MRSFSSLEENILYVFRPEGRESPELIGVTKGKNNPTLFLPSTATEEERKRLLNKHAEPNEAITDEFNLSQALTSSEEDACKITINELKDWSIVGASTVSTN